MKMLVLICLLFATTLVAQDRGMVNGILQDTASPKTVALTEAEQLRADKQGLVIEVAALNAQLVDRDRQIAELKKTLIDQQNREAQDGGQALVKQFYKDHGVTEQDYDFARNKDTGKWELVKKK